MTQEDEGEKLACPICGERLWLYRVYEEPITVNEDILDIGNSEWDVEFVQCPNCAHRPEYEWYNEVIVLA